MIKINSSEITPHHLYVSRRSFITGAGAAMAGLFLLGGAGCGPKGQTAGPPVVPGTDYCATAQASQTTDDLGDALTSCEDVISYNNYYEFSLSKDDVARHTGKFRPEPWTLEVGGLVKNPRTYSLDDLRAFDTEERIYRMRCVEAWSMVIPWMGFPLARLLKDADPTPKAKYVRFETLYDPDQMPGQSNFLAQFDWPYVEGLRLDEAMNDLTLLATGIYGNRILPQNGAPIRLVVPWKYGFKGIKSIVKIDLVEEMPTSLWMAASPREYGFYANVNPDVDHPRWSQSSERRIGEGGRRPTLLFNGYGEEVAHLYDGMDLAKFY